MGVVGDMCRALEKDFLRFADPIVSALLVNLQNTELDNSVKPPILGVFGDIAMAIGGEFERYLGTVMVLLYQASALTVDMDDIEMVEYLNEIRESILEAYIGIVQGLCDDKKHDILHPYLEGIFTFIKNIALDESREETVTRTASALIGDLASNLQGRCSGYISDSAIVGLIRQALLAEDNDDAIYAKEAVSRFVGHVW